MYDAKNLPRFLSFDKIMGTNQQYSTLFIGQDFRSNSI